MLHFKKSYVEKYGMKKWRKAMSFIYNRLVRRSFIART